MQRSTNLSAGTGLALVFTLALGACASSNSARQAEVEIRGTDPYGGSTAAAPAAPRSQPQAARGGGSVVSYDGYDAIVAANGDTVASLATEVGLSASELGAYNGLSPNQQLRAGDELVLPPRPGGYGGTGQQVAAAAPATNGGYAPPPSGQTGIEAQPLGTAAPPPSATAAPSGQSAGTDASAGWSPDLAAAAIARAGTAPAETSQPQQGQPAGTGTIAAGQDVTPEDGRLTPPPSSREPLPPNPEKPQELASPNLGQYQTPAPSARAETDANAEQAAAADRAAAQELGEATREEAQSSGPRIAGLSLVRPVEGPIVVEYNSWSAGGTRSEGIDIGAAVGTPVQAAADGTVALVSPSLGGLGTIIVLRHPDEVLTVYGRIEGVSVSKGDMVRRGQTIGKVARPPANAGEPRVHFEVRRGATSVDPMPYF